jgi:NhaP-type Na+/H+ or K+/H+ antiporter
MSRFPETVGMFEIVASILGLLIIVGVLFVAIRLLRQPTYRYQGDPTPQRRRSFRETMVVWLMGPRF